MPSILMLFKGIACPCFKENYGKIKKNAESPVPGHK